MDTAGIRIVLRWYRNAVLCPTAKAANNFPIQKCKNFNPVACIFSKQYKYQARCICAMMLLLFWSHVWKIRLDCLTQFTDSQCFCKVIFLFPFNSDKAQPHSIHHPSRLQKLWFPFSCKKNKKIERKHKTLAWPSYNCILYSQPLKLNQTL